MKLTEDEIKHLFVENPLLKTQISTMLRENSFLVFHTLQMFGPLRPKDIQMYTGISTGRMYNEISLLQKVGLVNKQKIRINDHLKSHYAMVEHNALTLINDQSMDLKDLTDADDDLIQIFTLWFRYLTNYPVLFQNFISKMANKLVHRHLKEREDRSIGDFTTHQQILKIEIGDYEILKSRLDLLIRDLDMNMQTNSMLGENAAISISLFRYAP